MVKNNNTLTKEQKLFKLNKKQLTKKFNESKGLENKSKILDVIEEKFGNDKKLKERLG